MPVINYETLTQYVDNPPGEKSAPCELPTITKKYTSHEELDGDNGKDIYVDRIDHAIRYIYNCLVLILVHTFIMGD